MNAYEMSPSRRRARRVTLVLAGTMLLGAGATPALAQDAEAKPVTVSGNVTLVTDYRFRGISLSGKDPAPQAGLTLTTRPGLYFGIWGSTISNFNGATTEIDLTAGWSNSFGNITPNVGIIGYLYPNGTGTDYYELFGSLGTTVGPVGLTVGLNVAPGQSNIARSNRYLYFSGNVGIPDTPITLNGSLGFERGGLVPDETGTRSTKTDWLLGASFAFDAFTFSASYVDTDLPTRVRAVPSGTQRVNRLGGGGVVVSIGFSF